MNRRIALVTHQFLPDFYAGTETLTLLSAKELAASGYQVAVFCGQPQLLTSSSQRLTRYQFEGIEVFAVVGRQEEHDRQDSEAAFAHISCTNSEIKPLFKSFLDSFRPELIHVFHFANLGLEIFEVADEHSLPIVFTVTDFFSVCPLSHLQLVDHSDCSGARYDGSNCLKHYLEMMFFDNEELDGFCDYMLETLSWLAQGQLSISDREKFVPAFAAQDWFRQYAEAFSLRVRRMAETLSKVDCLIVPSIATAGALAANGVSPFKMTFLPYGTGAKETARIEARAQKPLLTAAFIGQLTPHKGAHVAIEAIKKTEAALRLKIYGDLNADQAYAKRLETLSLSDDRIEFCGTFPPSELASILSSIDLLIVPSLWKENTPLIVLSAQAQGCPVVASDVEGISEVIEEGRNGRLFAPGDAGALSGILSNLAEDRELVDKLSQNAKAGRTQKEYGKDLVSVYEKLFKKLS